MMDIFDTKTISPMLIGKDEAAFDSDEFIFELKWDGIRCLAYLSPDGVDFRNKRNKNLNSTYPELSHIHKQAKSRCILDGELIILKEGKPNFFEVQRRSLMTNQLKIKLAAQKLPVSFVAYDIVYCNGEQITDKSLLERKAILERTVTESDRLTISRYFERDGLALYKSAADMGLEGIVAKRKDSKYYFDKRSSHWIKCKAMMDDDFIVCGYYDKGKAMVSVILGAFDGERIVYQSSVAMGVSREDYKIMSSIQQVEKAKYYPNFPEKDDAVWIVPQLVCTVEYMERTPHGGLRQPVFKGLRDDKVPLNCVVRR